MPERIGVAGAGRRVRGSRHDKSRSPERHNPALCLIAGPEHLEGEVSRYVLRLRHRERQLNITSSCVVQGEAKPTPSLAAKTWSEKRRVGRSLMPAAERSKLFSARVGWGLSCAGLRIGIGGLDSDWQTGANLPAAVCATSV